MKTILFFLAATFFLTRVHAQNGFTIYSDSTLSGLTNDLAIDAGNNKWLAFSIKGIGKFDTNQQFHLYNTYNSAIPSNKVYCLHANGYKLYAGTDSGLAVYESGVFQTMNIPGTSNIIKGIFFSETTLYALVDSALALYNEGNWSLYYPGNGFNVSSGVAHPIIIDSSGNIYFSNTSKLFKFSNNLFTVYSTPLNESFQSLFYDSVLNAIWCGTTSNTYLLTDGVFQNTDDLYSHSWLSPKNVKDICRKPDGILVFNAIGSIFSRGGIYELINNNFEIYYLNLFNTENSAAYPALYCVSDTNGLLWLSKYLGIAYGYLASFSESLHSNYSYYNVGLTNHNFKFIDKNNVRAAFGNRGGMFWDFQGKAMFEVPKGSGKTSLFAGSLWIAGKNQADDSLHCAAVFYNSRGNDFWPGPHTLQNPIDTLRSMQYDKIWKIEKWQVNELCNWQANPSAYPNYQMPYDIATWPGNDSLINEIIAPFYDSNNDGFYNPYQGDYPLIKGDQMLWWVNNDALANHDESGGKPLGIETRVSAYSYECNSGTDSLKDVNNTIFLNYKIINRSSNTYDSLYFGYYSDADLGYAYDDYFGCDVELNSAIFYNGSAIDGTGQPEAYGFNPPVQTVTLLQGPLANAYDGTDNDRDSLIDEACEQIMMSSFTSFYGSGCPDMCEPVIPIQFYNYISGKWKDGTHIVYGGSGHSVSGGLPASYMFPGNTDPYGWGTQGIPQSPWSETTAGNSPGDRRGIISMGPVTMLPGDIKEITLAFIWARDTTQHDPLNIYQEPVRKITRWFNQNLLENICTTSQAITDVKKKLKCEIWPNPASTDLTVAYTGNSGEITICDIFGRILYTTKISNEKTLIAIDKFSPGLYFVTIKDDNMSMVKKFVKK
ncbi:MAG: hypothetical protein A2275_00660 [Bacteroidetes bacterium RIFOXYA12_FULL_35_11]|nr:MAG: hypothetical protein A2X01_20890 [Bacteroidetes bacterium GWF2_35_48]OFY82070.1 MAG: hypothetical protein A2275_00660 [Bacteroidetes bacterium RIFOXYA12_FULL_35_11]OFY97527.1 MAG: hypothetical protein A2309_06560 [Bacteroidetes bacterium RIFOXYB2_FULL_35_7]OFZ04702.1 MAG: hypothetical protein A2491_13305 [Bacteroidetes bacterium RIFOXYC12_FULL_35_7]HBX51390.1 hypothetical protein [Bacteroidales bacterium]